MAKLRLQKIISKAGICSRRKAERLLTQNRVVINGRTAQIGDQADPLLDKIFPNTILSYKQHILGKAPHLLNNSSIVYFHGVPKPHQLKERWVQECWV